MDTPHTHHHPPTHPPTTKQAEAEGNVSLRVHPVEGGGGESFEVQARGELQLGLLIGGDGLPGGECAASSHV
jgi:GTP-binding protein